MVKKFEDFLEEDFNYMMSDKGDITLTDRWFYYDDEDEIIYGSDEMPLNPNILFSFNSKSCLIVINDKTINYNINNPICLIKLNLKTNEIEVCKDNVVEFLNEEGCDIIDFNQLNIQSFFDKHDEKFKYLLIKGNTVIATTFDIIEEN